MKPILNISEDFFVVGRIYAYDDVLLTIRDFRDCAPDTCESYSNSNYCQHRIIVDTNGTNWCSIEADFKKVTPKKRVRR